MKWHLCSILKNALPLKEKRTSEFQHLFSVWFRTVWSLQSFCLLKIFRDISFLRTAHGDKLPHTQTELFIVYVHYPVRKWAVRLQSLTPSTLMDTVKPTRSHTLYFSFILPKEESFSFCSGFSKFPPYNQHENCWFHQYAALQEGWQWIHPRKSA